MEEVFKSMKDYEKKMMTRKKEEMDDLKKKLEEEHKLELINLKISHLHEIKKLKEQFLEDEDKDQQESGSDNAKRKFCDTCSKKMRRNRPDGAGPSHLEDDERGEILEIFKSWYKTGKIPEQIMINFENLKEEVKCTICQEILIEPTVLNCGHVFCKLCLETWMEQRDRTNSKKCPECRTTIFCTAIDFKLNNIIDAAVSFFPDEAKDHRLALKLERQENNDEGPAKKRKVSDSPPTSDHSDDSVDSIDSNMSELTVPLLEDVHPNWVIPPPPPAIPLDANYFYIPYAPWQMHHTATANSTFNETGGHAWM